MTSLIKGPTEVSEASVRLYSTNYTFRVFCNDILGKVSIWTYLSLKKLVQEGFSVRIDRLSDIDVYLKLIFNDTVECIINGEITT